MRSAAQWCRGNRIKRSAALSTVGAPRLACRLARTLTAARQVARPQALSPCLGLAMPWSSSCRPEPVQECKVKAPPASQKQGVDFGARLLPITLRVLVSVPRDSIPAQPIEQCWMHPKCASPGVPQGHRPMKTLTTSRPRELFCSWRMVKGLGLLPQHAEAPTASQEEPKGTVHENGPSE